MLILSFADLEKTDLCWYADMFYLPQFVDWIIFPLKKGKLQQTRQNSGDIQGLCGISLLQKKPPARTSLLRPTESYKALAAVTSYMMPASHLQKYELLKLRRSPKKTRHG